MARIDTRWNAPANPAGEGAPFDTALLDRLMEEEGLDVLVATSRHSIRYLLGGYSFFFFERFDLFGFPSSHTALTLYREGPNALKKRLRAMHQC